MLRCGIFGTAFAAVVTDCVAPVFVDVIKQMLPHWSAVLTPSVSIECHPRALGARFCHPSREYTFLLHEIVNEFDRFIRFSP